MTSSAITPMSIQAAFGRFADYYSRHGFWSTIRRTAVRAHRTVFANRMIVFECSLDRADLLAPTLPDGFRIDRLVSRDEVSAKDLERLTSIGNAAMVIARVEERFAKGANLWIIRQGTTIAGYGWSLRGKTVEAYFFELADTDFHLFDFHVFAEFRGHGLNPLLVRWILASVAHETRGRAFIECAEWNAPQLASLKKTPFHKIGLARITTLFGRTRTRWLDHTAGERANSAVPELSHRNQTKGQSVFPTGRVQ